MESDYINKLVNLGKEKGGYLTYDHLNEILPAEMVDPVQIKEVFDTLQEEEIEVVDSLEEVGFGEVELAEEAAEAEGEEAAEPEEVPEQEGIVAAYFREMLRYSVLTPEEERELGKIIKNGQESILKMVCASTSGLEEIKCLRQKVQEWFQTEEKTAQAKEKLFRFIHQTLKQVQRRRPEAIEIKQLAKQIKYKEKEVTRARDEMIKANLRHISIAV